MRLQNYIMALLVTVAVLGVLSSIAIQMERDWGLTDEQIYNNSYGANDTIKTLDVFGKYSQLTMNATQSTPGASGADLGEATLTTGSSIQAAFKFVALLWTGPKLVIETFGHFFGVDPIWITTMLIWLTVSIAMIIIGSVFFQKI